MTLAYFNRLALRAAALDDTVTFEEFDEITEFIRTWVALADVNIENLDLKIRPEL